ncbi:hypothetical protein [Cesiribacter sp. SM1]|uniref:hypothetical protein n=1 Tax=Cesiribacter sp. SM1 TaxID=2861196 RepID=UPI001CD375E8|nr:hypothetical protein [Cesiribacter sp. SM1]
MHTEKHTIPLPDFPRFRESIQEINNLYGNILEVEQVNPPANSEAADAYVHLLLKGDQQYIQELLCHDRKKQLIQATFPILKRCPYCRRDFFLIASPLPEGSESLKPYYCPYDEIEAGKKLTKAAKWISLEYQYKRYNPQISGLSDRESLEEES